MRLRAVNIINEFSVLLPESQVLGLESMYTDHMPDVDTAAKMKPLFDAMFSNKHVVNVPEKLWMKMQGLTYFCAVGETEHANLTKQINSMCKVVSTKARKLRKVRKLNEKQVTVDELDAGGKDGFHDSDSSDGEEWEYRRRKTGPKNRYRPDSDSDDEQEGDYDLGDADGYVKNDFDKYVDEYVRREAADEAADDENFVVHDIRHWEEVDNANGHPVFIDRDEAAPVNRPVILMDPGHYGKAIMTWLMANTFISFSYHGHGVVTDYWKRGGVGLPALSDLFMAPIKYWGGTYEMVARVLPEISKQSDVMHKFVENLGENEFPILGQLSPSEMLRMLGATGDQISDAAAMERQKALQLMMQSEDTNTRGLWRVVNTLASDKGPANGPRQTLNLTKMYLHFKESNFMNLVANLVYTCLPIELVYSLGLYLKVAANYGITAAAGAVHEVFGALGESTKFKEFKKILGPIATEVIAYGRTFVQSKHSKIVKILNDNPEIVELMDQARKGAEFRFKVGTVHMQEVIKRTIESLVIFIPTAFSFVRSTFVVGYSLYKLCRTRPPDEIQVHRSPYQQVGRQILNGLDFYNTVIACSYATLELTAMAGVTSGYYGLDTVTGRASPILYASTVILQWYVNARIRERYKIDHSSQTMIPWLYEKLTFRWLIKPRIEAGAVSAIEGLIDTGIYGVTKTKDGAVLAISGVKTVTCLTGGLFVNIARVMATKSRDAAIELQRRTYAIYDQHFRTGSWVGSHEVLKTAKRIHTFDNLIQVHTYTKLI